MKFNSDDPCVCGHTYHMHEEAWLGICWYFGHRDVMHPCEGFVLDNLAYIEQLYHKKQVAMLIDGMEKQMKNNQPEFKYES